MTMVGPVRFERLLLSQLEAVVVDGVRNIWVVDPFDFESGTDNADVSSDFALYSSLKRWSSL